MLSGTQEKGHKQKLKVRTDSCKSSVQAGTEDTPSAQRTHQHFLFACPLFKTQTQAKQVEAKCWSPVGWFRAAKPPLRDVYFLESKIKNTASPPFSE